MFEDRFSDFPEKEGKGRPIEKTGNIYQTEL